MTGFASAIAHTPDDTTSGYCNTCDKDVTIVIYRFDFEVDPIDGERFCNEELISDCGHGMRSIDY